MRTKLAIVALSAVSMLAVGSSPTYASPVDVACSPAGKSAPAPAPSATPGAPGSTPETQGPGAGSSPAAVVDPPLYGPRWLITSIVDGDTVTPISQDEDRDSAYLVFREDGGFSGRNTCNIIGGTAVVEGDRITIHGLWSTRMFCPGPDVHDLEINAILQADPRYRIDGDRLYLTPDEGPGLVLRTAPVPVDARGA